MATKKKATPKAKTDPEVKADEIPAAEEIVENNEEAKVETPEKPIEEKTTEKKEEVKETDAPEDPAFLLMKPSEFMVGTKEYRDLVQMSNDLFGTMWNTHRVRPAVFYGMYKKLKDHFSKK